VPVVEAVETGSTGDGVWVRVVDSGVPLGAPSILPGPSGELYLFGQYMPTELETRIEGSNESGGAYLGTITKDGDPGWSVAWRGYAANDGADIAGLGLTADGGILVGGTFSGKIDFDPGSGSHDVDTGTGTSFYLSKFDSAGNWEWVKTWGNAPALITSLKWFEIDSNGDLLFTGIISGKIDMDPSPDSEMVIDGFVTPFVLKLGPQADFKWVRTWPAGVQTIALASDGEGGAYIAGTFRDTVDLDPGPGEYFTTVPEAFPDARPAFLCRFNSDGNFVWARTWGGPEREYLSSLKLDSSGDLLIAGDFSSTVDFDPGPGADIHVSLSLAGFLMKLSSDGEFRWAKTWGALGGNTESGHGSVYAPMLRLGSDGQYIVTGRFDGTVDFDPAPDKTQTRISPQGSGLFVSWFDRDGNLVDLTTCANGRGMSPVDLSVDSSGAIFLSGTYYESMDLRPEANYVLYSGPQEWGSFLMRMRPRVAE
jgi:hypothetical protein